MARKELSALNRDDRPAPERAPEAARAEKGLRVRNIARAFGARQVALLAAVGRAHVLAHPRPRVAVISTGSELVEPGQPVKFGMLPDSNGHLLVAACKEAGADAYRVGPIADDEEAFRTAVEDQIHRCDLIITSGGVSMGAYDTVKSVFQGEDAPGSVEFVKVAMSPGMPQGFGSVGDGAVPIITLPGIIRLPLARLIVGDLDKTVAEVMLTDTITLYPDDNAQQAAQAFERYDLVSAAVVEESGKLVGRLTVDKVVDYIRDKTESELLSQGGLKEEEDIFSSVWASVKNRWAWLAVNLITAFIASRVIGAFEGSIEKLVALAALMPMVAGIGGNSGNQTITMIVRALALVQITRENARKLFTKEIGVSAINGIGPRMVRRLARQEGQRTGSCCRPLVA